MEPSPADVARAGVIAVHAARWGMFPSTDRAAFEARLLALKRRAPRVSTWRLGVLLLLGLGRADRVLAALPATDDEEEDKHDLRLQALADGVARALMVEMPAAHGALDRSGLATRAVVLAWLRQSFWGTLSVAELGIATTLSGLHGPGYQACVALALLRRLHLGGGLMAAVREGAAAPRLHDLLLRAGHGFEFSPEVVAWMERVRARHGF